MDNSYTERPATLKQEDPAPWDEEPDPSVVKETKPKTDEEDDGWGAGPPEKEAHPEKGAKLRLVPADILR